MNTPLLLFLGDLGASEILLILVVVLVFFGAKRIPELARGLGEGLREFKAATSHVQNQPEQPGPPVGPYATAPPTRYAPLERLPSQPGTAGLSAGPAATE